MNKKTNKSKFTKIVASITLLLFTLLLSSCLSQKTSHISDTRFTMNTLIKIDIWTDSKVQANQVLTDSFDIIQKINNQTDRYTNLETYGLYNLNKLLKEKSLNTFSKTNESLTPTTLPTEYKKSKHLVYLLTFLENHKSSYFSAELAELIDLWKNAKEKNTPPSKAEVSEALKKAHYYKTLDLGGIAKGYAVDKAFLEIESNNFIKSALINAGGNIKVFGLSPNNKQWKIAIQHPRNADKYLGVLKLNSGDAVATSGDYQRYFEINGKRYHHILDPHTGYPAYGIVSVTVLSKSALEADYYSTLLFVAGLDKAKKILEKNTSIGAIILTSDNTLYCSDNIKDRFIKK